MLLPLSASVGNFSHCCDCILEDSCQVNFACCYTYAGILPDEVLADARGTAAEIS